jgi:hypothetical protein
MATANFIIKNNKELILHSLFGLLIGYFFLHPVSMVIHWVETNNSAFSWTEVERVFYDSMVHSFSFHMMPMSLAFTTLGLLGGLGSGIYYKSIKKKKYLLYGRHQLLQQSIPSLIANGKTEFVEFKPSLRHDYRQVKTDKNIELVVLKEIAGFLNAKGGTLIIGVDDYGEILGLANDYWSLKKKNKDGFQQRIILLVSNSFGKDICSRIHFAFHTIQDREICALYIDPSSRPVYLSERNNTVFYLRTGNVTTPLTTSETVKYLQTRRKI